MVVLKILGGEHGQSQDFGIAHPGSTIILMVHGFQQVINHHICGYNLGVVHAGSSLNSVSQLYSNECRMNGSTSNQGGLYTLTFYFANNLSPGEKPWEKGILTLIPQRISEQKPHSAGADHAPRCQLR